VTDWLAGTPFEIIPGATLGGLIAGALLPLLGVWVVLQRVVFLGITLAQVAAAGVALGMLLDLPPLLCGFIVCLVMVAWFTRGGQAGGIGTKGDAALGAAFCAASALALLFVSRSPVELDEVHHVLHGNLIYADSSDVILVSSVILGALVVTGLFFRRILFSAFDPEAAAALGLRPRRWMMLLFGVLAVVLAVSTRTTGSLLSFALLILPPLAALQLRRGLVGTFLLASALGLLGTAAGLWLAVSADLHLESSIAVCVFALLPLCWAFARHALAGVAVAAILVAAGLALSDHEAESRPTDLTPRMVPTPYMLAVHLVHPRLDEGELTLDWTLDLHRKTHDEELPDALWLVISAGGSTHEVKMAEDTASLSDQPEHRGGSVSFAVTGEVTAVTGQVWSGPLSGLDSLPIDHAHVHGCRLE
jgi:zinc transport system permease protein